MSPADFAAVFSRVLARRSRRFLRKYYVVAKHDLPHCGARCRDGHPCQRRAVFDAYRGGPRNGRCRNHGGLSTGPRTPEGKRRVGEAARRGEG
jgi:hypothetical protein